MSHFSLGATYPEGYAVRRAPDRELEAEATEEWAAAYRQAVPSGDHPSGLTTADLDAYVERMHLEPELEEVA